MDSMPKALADKIYDDALLKALNNPEMQAYIRPTDYGFGSNAEGLNGCACMLRADGRFVRVSVAGKDKLDLRLNPS